MRTKWMAILAIATAFAFPEANAQEVKSVKGRVVTPDQKGADGATVQLVGDTLLQTTKTDSAGYFLFYFDVPGSYRLQVTMIGFQTAYLPFAIEAAKDSNLVLPVIQLSPLANTLSEVTVVGKKPFIEQKLDRTVVNVGNLIAATGLNALEVLERAPGVLVDGNGNVTLKGKTGVLILLDGKPTYLSGDQLATYLRSLPAATIEQIELMPNPPAKYEAAGTGGVIQIRTKKARSKGWNGSVVASAGRSRASRGSAGVNLNYYKGKVNLFGNYSHSLYKSNRVLELERNYFGPSGQLATQYKQTASFRPDNKSRNLKLGMDYFISPKTTTGLLFNSSFSPSRYVNPVTAFLYNGQGLLDSIIQTTNRADNRFDNSSLNLNFLRRLDSAGSTLSADVDRVRYKGKNEQQFLNNMLRPDGTIKSTEYTTASLPANITIYTAKTDYAKMMRAGKKLEGGFKTSLVEADNLAQYLTWANNVPSIDERNTHTFRYEENIHAGYVNYSSEGTRFSFQTGLRIENTHINGLQAGNRLKPDSSFGQQYTHFFPTAYFSYKLDSSGKHVLSAYYGRRIDRPFYKDLNPFIYIVDKYTWFAGNPFLQPQLSSNYSLSYHYRTILSASLFYNHYQRFQTEAVFQEGGIFISRPSNIGRRIYQGASVSLSAKPAGWWNSTLYSEVVNMKFKGQLQRTFLQTSSTYFYLETGNQFELGKGWGAELNGFYITRRVAAQFSLDQKGQLGLGVQKRFWNNKASLRCAVADLFLTNISAGSITHVEGATSSYRNDFDTRLVTLGFSYNVGRGAGNAPKKRSTGSSQAEQNRVKN